MRKTVLFPDDGDGGFPVMLAGLNRSRRLYRGDSMWNIDFASRFPIFPNQIVRWIAESNAWLDISGGDSFTDLYGQDRFDAMAKPKEIALRLGVPVVLLPQTYGPFASERNRQRAAAIVQQSHLAIARDETSFQTLTSLSGDRFEASKHLVGVDAAFLLPAIQPTASANEEFVQLVRNSRRRLVGLNVSGLIHNNPLAAKSQFGFMADYREIIQRLIKSLCQEDDATVVLVPHVVPAESSVESDTRACKQVMQQMASEVTEGKLVLAPDLSDPRHVKWLISQMDWFCGTRMHSTIAALSQGVPTAAIAYSVKTLGVFKTCNQSDCVVDPRSSSTSEVHQSLLSCYASRQTSKDTLVNAITDVKTTASLQMDKIASIIQSKQA